jgi:hypothetical protein
MLNKLTIRKQSDYNDLIIITNKFIDIGGLITNIKCDDFDNYNPVIICDYKDSEIRFILENDDEIVMYSDLDIKETYELYQLIEDN